MAKVPTSATVSFNLNNAPKFATELGQLTHAASALEWTVFKLFHMLSDMPEKAARLVFYGINNFRTRIEITKALVLLNTAETDAEKKLIDALDRAYSRYKTRNRYAHSPLCFVTPHKADDTFVARLNIDATPERMVLEEVHLNDLREAARLLEETGDEIVGLMKEFAPLIHEQLRKLREAPHLILRYAMKGAPRQAPQSGHS
jgi:hypothetical protein